MGRRRRERRRSECGEHDRGHDRQKGAALRGLWIHKHSLIADALMVGVGSEPVNAWTTKYFTDSEGLVPEVGVETGLVIEPIQVVDSTKRRIRENLWFSGSIAQKAAQGQPFSLCFRIW